jgi:hypothetical protein
VATVDRIAQALGPDWPALRFTQLYDRAYELERAARLNRTLAAYMVETATETAGEAIARLQAATLYRPGESFSSAEIE